MRFPHCDNSPGTAVKIGLTDWKKQGVLSLRATRKRLIIGFASIAILDFAGFITMIAIPDLTARVIPALAGVQIFGFLAIAVIVVTGRREYISEEANRDAGTGKQWVPWLFGFLALMSFMRVGLALLYMAGEEGRRHSWFSPVAGTAMGCFFLWLAVLAGRSVFRGKSKQKTTDSNPGL